MTAKSLKHAAEMFIYLGSCPGPFATWVKFYSGEWSDQRSDSSMFSQLADHPDLIMLTLNRIMKKSNITPNNGNLTIKNIARKLLKRMDLLLTMKFAEIQSGKVRSSFENMTIIKSFDREGNI